MLLQVRTLQKTNKQSVPAEPTQKPTSSTFSTIQSDKIVWGSGKSDEKNDSVPPRMGRESHSPPAVTYPES
ncbi:hypothetical protein CSKR_200691 [Clonorchis sinensis]|uniref:Uncharacterized protein n=1 Tax=Clonorchis sinensis TaxID=79923 RepID=A0A8T1MGA9_CLOSI|nr:hypothetical protein CSKR_200691 [Clonorchis sinensis]